MRKWIGILLATMFLAGCGAAARESGFYDNKTMYQSWDHMKFSMCGYKQPDEKAAQLSREQGWWGIPVESSR